MDDMINVVKCRYINGDSLSQGKLSFLNNDTKLVVGSVFTSLRFFMDTILMIIYP